LFSEPDAGSDLASLQTRAVRVDDGWLLSGQTVWTSYAQFASWGICLARTDPDAPKHKGISYLVVDMQAPGIEVRPLVQITGDAEFNEVFFTGARVPDSMRIGAVGEGWRVALTTLMNERVSLSGAGSAGGDAIGGASVQALVHRHAPVLDPVLRQRLAELWIESRVIRLNNQRAGDARRAGQEVGSEGSITKLQQAKHNQKVQNLAIDLDGAAALAWDGESIDPAHGHRGFIRAAGGGEADVVRGFFRAQANTIEGGTSDIMRNILGERVLGLPKEPDVSRDLAWADVPRSS
ncbi:MAG: acyl-CoA dehydrogenase family protein, partial [Acidimicrobiia bacterium]